MGFHVKLDLPKYADIIPDLPSAELIINYNLDDKDSKWKKNIPNVITSDFIALEAHRLRKGAFIKIKDEVLWIPPNYYHYLQYGIAGGVSPQFRLKKLKHTYFKIWVRNNKEAIGTYTIKNRQDGETTSVMSDSLWEFQDGINYHGQIGIQSKTNDDAYNPCWLALKSQWMNYPEWYKELMYPDFASGKNIETQMRFERGEDMKKNLRGEYEKVLSRNLLATYYPSVYNAMDGKQNVIKCILDEINKWKNCSIFDTLINYKKFILVGSERKGLFDMFSSPSDINGRWNDEAYQLWCSSNPDKLNENGTTDSRIFRYHSDPLEGIQGMYDEFGDADPERILNFIMRERKALPADKQLGEIRGLPLNEEEMFGQYEANTTWDNHKGIITRKIYLIGTNVKDTVTQEPKAIWGNLEWENGIMDVVPPVFRPQKENVFDINTGRFLYSFLPKLKAPLNNIKRPPETVDSCLGIDPFNNRYGAKKKSAASNAGVVDYQFRDLANLQNFVPRPTMIYSCRPHQDIFFEDMIKAAVFNRSLVQYENRSDKLANYFEDRGYFDWLLPEIGQPKDSFRKGDAPSGRSSVFLNEGMYLINALTNVPINPEKPYLLNHIWFEELLKQIEEFNPENTQKYDLVMGLIQALIGAAKISSMKVRDGRELASSMIDYLTG